MLPTFAKLAGAKLPEGELDGHGVWPVILGINSFHDLRLDPAERHNLIDVPEYQERIQAMRETMFADFESLGGLNAPIRVPTGERLDQRKLP